jgi:hypothetical protein
MRVSTLVVPAAVGLALWAADAGAQAWLPPKGEATVSLGFLHSSADGHLDYQGTPPLPAT